VTLIVEPAVSCSSYENYALFLGDVLGITGKEESEKEDY